MKKQNSRQQIIELYAGALERNYVQSWPSPLPPTPIGKAHYTPIETECNCMTVH